MNFNVQSGAGTGSLRYQNSHEPPVWLEVLVDVSRRGFVQLAVTLISLLWIVVSLGRNYLRGQSSKVKAYKPRGILIYECLGQLLRAATLALFIVASSRAFRQWPNAVATGYVFLLGIFRVTAHGTFRQVLLRHINTISLCTFLFVGFAEILPLLVVASTYRPGAVTVAAFVALSCYLLVAGMSPREWFPPKEGLELPDGTTAEPAKEETCSIFDYYSTFSRVDTLIRKGFKGSITMNEMDKVPSHFNPEVLRRRFSTLRAKHKTTAKTMFFLLWPQIIFSIVIGILMGLAELFAPFSLYRILDYLGAPEEAIFKPVVWLVVMFGGRMVHTLLNQIYAVTTRKLAIYIKLMLTADIYQVALASHELEGNFSKAADNKEEAEHEASTSAIGILENMISTDINSIMMLRVFLMAITTMPSAIFAVAGLYAIVGWPCFVGLGLMVVGSPLASLISKYITIYQEKLKVAQDSRISLASEYLRSVKVIKYFGWEDSVVKLIGEARAGEQKHIWTVDMLYFWMMEISACIPIVSLLSIFALFVGVEKKILTASVAYTTITLLNLVRDDFMFLAGMWLDLPKAIVSFRRLDSFFSAATPLEAYPHGPVQVREATFRRTATADFRLYDLSIDFAQNGLNVVSGVSGSGKTTLLLALLGETVKEAGHVVRQKDAAFASQSSWLQSTTIRDNIIFNSMDDPERYKSVIQACCLDMDFAELPKGDQTEVGENGSALSGGQRARVALARALYSWSSLLLLDDIFSALDTKTSLELWNRVFCSDIIKHRTVILVTQLSWIMQEADVAITLDNGRVKSMEQNIGHVRTPKIARGDVEGADEPASDDTKDKTPDVNTEPTDTTEDGQAEAEGAGLTVVDEEVASTGVLGGFAFVPYLFYFGSPVVVTLTLSTLFIHTGVNVLTNYWMSLWVDKADSYAQTTFYLSVYIGLSFASEGVDALAVWAFLRGGWVAAKTLHERMIKSLFDVSLNWYTANPVGRVINRLSGDVENLDQQISMPLFYVLMTIVKAFMMLGAVTTVLPGFIVPVIVLSIIGVIIGAVYNRTAVFLRQLVSSSQSPILSDFSEGLSGMMVVRATRSTQTTFTNKMSHLLYASAQANAGQIEADQWLKFRMNTLASAINAVAALLAILQSSRLSAGIVGFCLSQATQMSEMILYLVFNISEVNIQMQTFHRVREYTRLPPEEEKKENTGKAGQVEDDSDEAEYPTPTNWPNSGTVEFRDVTVRYNLDGPDILKKVNLRFNAGERVAVVGRTGSGKSTLVLSILRFTNIVSGQIFYDGVDVTHVPRKQLRQAVSTIPQEAQLFQGTLAANLDPTGTIPESHLQKTLEVCQSLAAMKRDTQATTTAEDGSNVNFSERLALTTKVKARGENFSHGQRQVLSLCRVLARRSKLVLLDEATSSMDAETDAGVQKALSDEFSSSDGNKRCLITIAHRLQTIADYDKVVVMSSGEVVEVGSPRDLMEKKGAFYDMVMHDREEDSIAVVNQ